MEQQIIGKLIRLRRENDNKSISPVLTTSCLNDADLKIDTQRSFRNFQTASFRKLVVKTSDKILTPHGFAAWPKVHSDPCRVFKLKVSQNIWKPR